MQLSLLLLAHPSREQAKHTQGLGFQTALYYSLSPEWELSKLDLPMLSNSKLLIDKLIRWSDLYFSRQHLALRINTWLDGEQLLSKTFQTVKPRMWLGECQESSMSIWVRVCICKCQSFLDRTWRMKGTGVVGSHQKDKAESKPFWEGVRCN